MPLAHPQTITTTNNYDEPCVAVAFATSRPGEPLVDFKHRLSVRDHYSRTGGVELVLDREAAVELVRLLIPVERASDLGFRQRRGQIPASGLRNRVRRFESCRGHQLDSQSASDDSDFSACSSTA